jgi:hypothetical protein
MPGVALHAVETATVHRDHGSLHVNQIVLAQTALQSFLDIVSKGPSFYQRALTALSTRAASAW